VRPERLLAISGRANNPDAAGLLLSCLLAAAKRLFLAAMGGGGNSFFFSFEIEKSGPARAGGMLLATA